MRRVGLFLLGVVGVGVLIFVRIPTDNGDVFTAEELASEYFYLY